LDICHARTTPLLLAVSSSAAVGENTADRTSPVPAGATGLLPTPQRQKRKP